VVSETPPSQQGLLLLPLPPENTQKLPSPGNTQAILDASQVPCPAAIPEDASPKDDYPKSEEEAYEEAYKDYLYPHSEIPMVCFLKATNEFLHANLITCLLLTLQT